MRVPQPGSSEYNGDPPRGNPYFGSPCSEDIGGRASEKPRSALDVLRQSLGGRNLIAVGLGDDLLDCDGSRGQLDVVPVYTAADNIVKLLHK